ncbi:MAG: glycosyltransferase [Candidatus Amulumruptor caecigallinarius]|nr:glycosyltransferase [Candidatus Amulumruptor caecigallinarius]MCM1396357.1 glycosyltransferase [Candidatus Amulumruptor caecigallinarius]MCM1453701.1 glycosyltransferase [bacterium]
MPTPDHADLKASLRARKVCVLIPTYNNGGTVVSVLTRVLDYCDDVIVVNDGSTDNTALLLRNFAGKVDVVTHPSNRGKGAALKTGLLHALSRGFDYAITLDSDGQHYPSDIPAFARAIMAHPGALIAGERDLTSVDINGKSSFANKFSNFWFAVQTGRRLRDTQCGYRAYPLRRLRSLALLTARYEAELELLVLSAWSGTPIVTIPIRVYYPPQSQRVSHFRPALDFTRISILNTLLCLGAVAWGYPAKALRTVRRGSLREREFTLFTRRKGEKREAAITLGRIGRTIFGMGYFALPAITVLSPLVSLYFSIGKVTERKRLWLHRLLRRSAVDLTRRFPGGTVSIENPSAEDFSRPALIVCNHQSHLDLPVVMSVHHKLVFLTNDRVWHSPVYGSLIHKAEYLPVSCGMEELLPRLRDLRDRGYSIVVFPEGTRSGDSSLLRFRQGAFLIARELALDIVPMVLHGAGHFLRKGDPFFRRGHITLCIMPRVPHDPADVTPPRKCASFFRKLIADRHAELAHEVECAAYFRSALLYRYAWRGRGIVAAAKRELATLPSYAHVIDAPPANSTLSPVAAVRIINSGIGLFPLLYALVHPDVEVHAFEESVAMHRVATATTALPPNIHFHRPESDGDYCPADVRFDKTFLLMRGDMGVLPSSIGSEYITVNLPHVHER